MHGTPCPEQTDLPAENRVGEFFEAAEESAPEIQPQVLALHYLARPVLVQTVSGRCILAFIDPYGLEAGSATRSELPWYEKMFNKIDDWLYEDEQNRTANRELGNALAYDYMNNPKYAEARGWHEGLGSVADKLAVATVVYGGYQALGNLAGTSALAPKTRVGYHATYPEAATGIRQTGFRPGTKPGRLGSGGTYVSSGRQGAIAEFTHHNPGVKPDVLRVRYNPGVEAVTDLAPGSYVNRLPLNVDSISAPSVRLPSAQNTITYNPLEVLP